MSDGWTRTPVIIETGRHRITGNVAVPEGARLSDYANETDRSFFALTDATIAPINEPDRQRPVGFMLVNRNEVALVMEGSLEEGGPAANRLEQDFGDFFSSPDEPSVGPAPPAAPNRFTAFS